MKKILGFIIAIIWSILWNIALANATWTTFQIDENFFESTNFSTWDYSTIKFWNNIWNSFWWLVVRWPSFWNETELTMNWQTIYCKKQIRWFYINQARWNIVWPLDNFTLATFKSNPELYPSYHKLSLEWWFFTRCTWDMIDNFNWIYGYVKHTTVWWQTYDLRAWFEYTPATNNIWNNRQSTLNRTIDTDSNSYKIQWYILDSYWQIWYIDTDWRLNWNISFYDISGEHATIKIHSNKNALYHITWDFITAEPQWNITWWEDLYFSVDLYTWNWIRNIYLKLSTWNEEIFDSASITIETVDNIPPVIEIISPSSWEAINWNDLWSGIINFVRSWYDNAGITTYRLYISWNNDLQVYPGITSTNKSVWWFVNWDYTRRVEAEDINNNIWTSEITPFYVRWIWNIYPITITKTINPTNPTVWETVKFTITFTNTLNKYIKNVKIYDIAPENLTANRNNIGEITDEFILLFSWTLNPLETRTLAFTWIITEKWYFENNAMVMSDWWFSAIATVQSEISESRLELTQTITPDEDLIIDQDIEYEITLTNNWDWTGYDIVLSESLSDIFVYEWEDLTWEDNSFILFTWDLWPGESVSYKINWYTENEWVLRSVAKVTSSNNGTIEDTKEIEIHTNICGNGIIELWYEQCDDWENNGKINHCSKYCRNNTYWVACKYSDAQYLANGAFIDTLKHRWFEYIEIMRNSCLHRWKSNYLWLWKYHPDEYVTKAEVLKTLVKIRWIAKNDFNISTEDMTYSGAITFKDVWPNHWFAWYSFYAYNNGLTDWLYSSSNWSLYLKPDSAITRNEIIKAVVTLYKEIVNDDPIDISWTSEMTDVKPWNKYYPYIREAEELWFISWYPSKNWEYLWKWDQSLTRAEFAKIVSIPFTDILFGE